VTPPFALAAYGASAIAQSDPVKTGNQAVVLSSMIFITPFIFVYTPILLNGTTLQIVVTVIGCALGAIAWAMFIEAYALTNMTATERILAGVGAAFLLLPVDHMIDYFLRANHRLFYETYTIGALLALTAAVMQLRRWRAAVVA
jgi:TRAP-type uncharacterized transport system fused permease subunit